MLHRIHENLRPAVTPCMGPTGDSLSASEEKRGREKERDSTGSGPNLLVPLSTIRNRRRRRSSHSWPIVLNWEGAFLKAYRTARGMRRPSRAERRVVARRLTCKWNFHNRASFARVVPALSFLFSFLLLSLSSIRDPRTASQARKTRENAVLQRHRSIAFRPIAIRHDDNLRKGRKQRTTVLSEIWQFVTLMLDQRTSRIANEFRWSRIDASLETPVAKFNASRIP